jgi:hypothetical protein
MVKGVEQSVFVTTVVNAQACVDYVCADVGATRIASE